MKGKHYVFETLDFNSTAQPQNIQINPADLPRYNCNQCGATDFIPKFNLFEIPQLMRFATNGQDLLQMQVWTCMSCGKSQIVQEMKKLAPLSSVKAETIEQLPEGDLETEKPIIEVVK